MKKILLILIPLLIFGWQSGSFNNEKNPFWNREDWMKVEAGLWMKPLGFPD
jgi:hypothetical protein